MKIKLKGATANSNHEHALLSPSAASKWINCSAALACEFGIPNESGQAAVNGTCMHYMSETLLRRIIAGADSTAKPWKGSHVLNSGKGPIKALVGPRPGSVLITDDFVSQVDKYVDYCRPIIDAAELVEIESRVNLTRVLHPGTMIALPDEGDGIKREKQLQTFGTADLVAVMPRADGSYLLIVGDLKTGRHRVSAKENKQMMLYALGLLRVYRRLYDITAVRLVIFQPYAGGADEWDTSPEALEQFGKFARVRAERAIDVFQRGKKGLKPGDFNPGNDQCKWCRFSEQCNAKRKIASDLQVDANELASESDSMTLDVLKSEWDRLPLMRQHIADIEKAMYAALMRGAKVEGLKLVEGREGNRSWSDAKAAGEAWVDAGYEEALLQKEVMLSPTEADKTLTKEQLAVLEPFITRKPCQPSVTTADDKRPEWRGLEDDDLAD